MRFLEFIFLILSINYQIFSQNLILNPSFEDAERCTEELGDFNKNVVHWKTPTNGTTDLFNSCADHTARIPNNYFGYQTAKDGKKYAGCYLYSKDNYREYIQGKFSHPLEKGKSYKLSFYISLAEKSDFSIKKISFLLSEEEINISNSQVLSAKQLKTINLGHYKIYEIESNRFYDNTSSWDLVSIAFLANGNEQYITIGSFEKDSKIALLPAPAIGYGFNFSYYYIDMVSLEGTTNEEQETKPTKNVKEELKVNLQPNRLELDKTYTFQNVVFDFNSAELSIAAKFEIETVYQVLIEDTNTNIIISGHTDNIGTFDFNQKLSKKRAESVVNYLIELGLKEYRINSVGFGDTKPITTNNTEDGRNQNRRVEFVITTK